MRALMPSITASHSSCSSPWYCVAAATLQPTAASHPHNTPHSGLLQQTLQTLFCGAYHPPPMILRCLQVSSTVGGLSQQVESVAATSAAAVAELSTKLDSLQSDVGQMKQLLMALLERQQ